MYSLGPGLLIRPKRFWLTALSLSAFWLTALSSTLRAEAQAPSEKVISTPAVLAPDGPAGADGGAHDAPVDGEVQNEPAWHDSILIWDHSATAETVGLGQDVQSRNPTYEMTFRFAPRYYLHDAEHRDLSLRADVSLIREFTDSDTTTERGEWTFTDAELWLLLSEQIHQTPSSETDFVLRAPSVRLPTSYASFSNGRLVGLGGGIGLDHRQTLAGKDAVFFSATLLRPRVGYTYQFVRTTVPTNDAIDRVRLTPSGRSLPSDQLSGTAFPQHELNLSLRTETDLVGRFGLITDVGLRYARRYALSGGEEICGVVDTGCVAVPTSSDAPRWGVSTLFAVEVAYLLTESVILSLGYSNLSGQLGADGQRRSIFYSPDARISLSATLVLDEVYRAFQGAPTSRAARLNSASPPF